MAFSPHVVVPIPSAVLDATIRGMDLSNAARYLGAVGLVALLYDHSLTLGDEVNLIWTARRSFLKWIFLTNHYMVGVCLIVVTNEMSGFNELINNDQVSASCQKFLTVVACFSMISTFVSNFLGFLRVITLWDKSPRIVLGLSVALALSFIATMACTVVSIMDFEPSIGYDPGLKLCSVTVPSKPYIVLWATPLAFDITVLAFIVYNSLSNPRDLNTSLRRALYRDGILFFLFVALIRVVNLAFVIKAEAGLAGLPGYFSWAVITLACRRFLIHVYSCEQEAAQYDDLNASLYSPMETESESAIELHSHRLRTIPNP